MKVERVKYVIWAADPGRAVRFYRDVLGGEVVKESDVISEVIVCGATIGIHGGGEGERTWTGLAFQVPERPKANCDPFASSILLRTLTGRNF